MGHVELERLLEFMYNGEVSIAQDQLAAFLKTAENLKIRGLAGSSDEMDQAGVSCPPIIRGWFVLGLKRGVMDNAGMGEGWIVGSIMENRGGDCQYGFCF